MARTTIEYQIRILWNYRAHSRPQAKAEFNAIQMIHSDSRALK